MNLMEQFRSICQDFPAFREALAQSREFAHEPQLREQMDRMFGELDRAFASLQKDFPTGVAAMEKDVAAARRNIEEAERRIAEADRQIKAAEQSIAVLTVPAIVPPALPAPDAKLGARLRQEILAHFFSVPRRPAGPGTGEVAEMESGDW